MFGSDISLSEGIVLTPSRAFGKAEVVYADIGIYKAGVKLRKGDPARLGGAVLRRGRAEMAKKAVVGNFLFGVCRGGLFQADFATVIPQTQAVTMEDDSRAVGVIAGDVTILHEKRKSTRGVLDNQAGSKFSEAVTADDLSRYGQLAINQIDILTAQGFEVGNRNGFGCRILREDGSGRIARSEEQREQQDQVSNGNHHAYGV